MYFGYVCRQAELHTLLCCHLDLPQDFIYAYEWVVIIQPWVLIPSSLSIHPLIGTQVVSIFDIETNVVMNLGVHTSFKTVLSHFGDKYSKLELMDHKVVLILIFWAIYILFSTVAAPIYILIKSEYIYGQFLYKKRAKYLQCGKDNHFNKEMFTFIHILTNTYFLFFDNSHANRHEAISPLFSFPFL